MNYWTKLDASADETSSRAILSACSDPRPAFKPSCYTHLRLIRHRNAPFLLRIILSAMSCLGPLSIIHVHIYLYHSRLALSYTVLITNAKTTMYVNSLNTLYFRYPAAHGVDDFPKALRRHAKPGNSPHHMYIPRNPADPWLVVIWDISAETTGLVC